VAAPALVSASSMTPNDQVTREEFNAILEDLYTYGASPEYIISGCGCEHNFITNQHHYCLVHKPL